MERDAIDPAQAAADGARLGELLASGRYPRFAAAISASGPPRAELAAEFDRLLDRIIDGLIPGRPAGPPADPPRPHGRPCPLSRPAGDDRPAYQR